MNDDHERTARARAYAAEGAIWAGLAALLPDPEQVDEVQSCWDIGEQEAGLEVLVHRLTEQGLPVGESARAELAVMAEQWGVWDLLGASIAGCAEDAERPRWRVLEDGAEETLPLRAVVPESTSPQSEVVPWIVCPPCGRVLARVHRREEWGGLSFLTESYVVFAEDRAVAPLVFDREDGGAAWAALDALCTACGGGCG